MKKLILVFSIICIGIALNAQTNCINPIIAQATGFDGEDYIAGYSIEFEIQIYPDESGYWDFGDGTDIQTVPSYQWDNQAYSITHSYAEAGTYEVSFTKGDNYCIEFLTITVIEAPFLIPIVPDYFEGNPKWCVNKRWVENQGGCINYVDQVHYINGDTTFNNTLYKKLYTRGVSQGCGIAPEHYNFIESFLRQDGEKIYRYYPEENSEHIMYDFSLQVGDTLEYGGVLINDEIFPQWPNGDVGFEGMLYIVSNVDSIFLVNQYFKKIHFDAYWDGTLVSPITDNAITDSYIEGIGHQFGFIWQYYGIGEGESRGLFAFSKNDTLYYEFEENGGLFLCDFDVSVNEQLKEESIVNLYPNPANEILHIEGSGNFQLKGYCIYTINGIEILKHDILPSKTHTISLKNLNSGMYLIEVETTESYRDIQRFVVEK